jgi:hypothetical protein
MFKVETKPPTHKETIDLGEAGSFIVLVRRPTWNEKITDEGLAISGYLDNNRAELRGQSVEHRIRSTIVGWEELFGSDDQPIPFSWDQLVVLCERYPLVFDRVEGIANRQYMGVAEPELKNSEAPLSATSEATSAATHSSNTP